MKLLRAQGLNDLGLFVVFHSLIVSKMMYASQAFSGHLHVNELGRLQSSLDKAYKWGFTSVKYDIKELFELADYKLFKCLSRNSEHCLFSSLPEKRNMYGRNVPDDMIFVCLI